MMISYQELVRTFPNINRVQIINTPYSLSQTGFTRQELLENCLPENDANERTVDSHVSKLRKKFSQAGLSNIPESIRGFGYRLGIDMVHRSINSQLFLLTLKVVISTLVLISAVYSTYFMIFYDWHSPPAFSWIHDSLIGLAPIFPDTFIALPITGSPPQIFPWRTISQCTVRMPFVVMFEGLRKVLCRC